MSNMEKHLFNLKFAAKELNRNSKKCDKEEKAEKAKIKKAIQKGNMEVARIHAENAIRQKNQAINFLRMSARVDAVAARVQTAVTMGKVRPSSSCRGKEETSHLLWSGFVPAATSWELSLSVLEVARSKSAAGVPLAAALWIISQRMSCHRDWPAYVIKSK
ncbi:charged multivesicular body protein 1b-like [Pyrgilauda ruficollis]|uniref:charged multivesicular body protein 1b-like n=1 Tax=Pyrgilauda ruficollis TaxID=221976 RepID=UPI001B86E1B6|nr:charged multivesicular body protein 1b-like [Pyrgilauda ruficollis]